MCSCFEPRPWLEASICNMIETHRNKALFHKWHVFLISSDLHNHESLSMSSSVLTESHRSHCHTFFREFFEHRTPNLGEWCKCSWPHSINLCDNFFQPSCFYYFQMSTIFNLSTLHLFFIFNIASKLQVAFALPQSPTLLPAARPLAGRSFQLFEFQGSAAIQINLLKNLQSHPVALMALSVAQGLPRSYSRWSPLSFFVIFAACMRMSGWCFKSSTRLASPSSHAVSYKFQQHVHSERIILQARCISYVVFRTKPDQKRLVGRVRDTQEYFAD